MLKLRKLLKALKRECKRRVPSGRCVSADKKELADHEPSVPIATACSGSDCVVTGVQCLEKTITGDEAGERPVFRHGFACDNDTNKQDYLRTAFPGLRKMFACISGLKSKRAINVALESMPDGDVGSAFLFPCGFVCKDISTLRLGELRQQARSGIKDGTGRTGGTFKHAIGHHVL